MEPIETIEHAGCMIELHQDDDPMPPSDWDTLGVVYALTPDAQWRGFEDCSETHGQAIEAMERGGAALLRRYLRLCYGVHAVAVQVDDYGSSGVQLSTDDGPDDDDNHYNAYMAATPETIEKTGVPADRIEEGLRGELREWSAYFAGEVVGYVVKFNGETVGSCWGFYPDNEPSNPYKNNRANTNAYIIAWDNLPEYLRGYAYALAEAFEEAEYEQAKRARAANQGIATV